MGFQKEDLCLCIDCAEPLCHEDIIVGASFHPTEDIIISATLDETVRVWDTTGLRRKKNGDGELAFDSVSFSFGPSTSSHGYNHNYGHNHGQIDQQPAEGGLKVQAESLGT